MLNPAKQTTNKNLAIVTAYQPDDGFVENFTKNPDLISHVLILDNSPAGSKEIKGNELVDVIRFQPNQGLAAYNDGILWARENGFQKVFLFDQDSKPTRAALVDLIALHETKSQTSLRPVAVGPTFLDESDLKASKAWETTDLLGEEVDCLPTSGLLLSVNALSSKVRFSDDLFLDLVDYDWCWQQGSHGWRFFRSRSSELIHRQGRRQVSILGINFFDPPPYRHYFQVRNALQLAGKSYVPARWKFRLLSRAIIKAMVLPVALDKGFERLVWMVRGVRDGFRNIKGAGALEALLNNPRSSESQSTPSDSKR